MFCNKWFFFSGFIRAPIGMVMMIVGGILMGIGRRGAAASGLVLDPEKAREEMKPWNKMEGGMINDTLSEIEVVNKVADNFGARSKEAVKVRCRSCHALNDESARYCNQCGAEV